MGKIVIVTDSNSGIHQDEAEQLGIVVIPMPFFINNNEYLEDITLSVDDFYSFLEDDSIEVSTSQPSVSGLISLWEDLLTKYDEVIYMPMTSGLSGTCATATVMANDFDGKVVVIDNKRISVTLRGSIAEALELAKKGKTAKEIKEYLESTAYMNSIYIVVPQIKYLKKGGRLTPSAALLASMLRIKPILYSCGEKFEKFATPITMRQGRVKMIEQVKKEIETKYKEDYENGNVYLGIAYSQNRDEALDYAKEVKQEFPDLEIAYVNALSLSIACHIGPNALALAVFIKRY